MPFKVRCKLSAFMGDEERFPCHFDYKIGDEFSFDGERFAGRICPGLWSTMIPVLMALHRSGNAHPSSIVFRYSGLSVKDPSMKKYDGIGFRPLKEPIEGSLPKHVAAAPDKPVTEALSGLGFVCGDSRTSAFFIGEPYDLADKGDSLPYYNRQMAILDKIKEAPGLTAEEILEKFTDWERDEIYPPLTLFNTRLLMDELESVLYIEYRDGKAYPTKK